MSGEEKRNAARQRIAQKRAAEAAARAAAERRRRTVIGGVAAAVVLVVALVVVFVVQSSRTSTDTDAAAPTGTTGDGYTVAVGAADAPVTLDLYEDFQCPACAQLEASSGDTVQRLVDDGTVRLRYHGMAFLDRASTTEYSSRALNAAAVVLDAGGTDAYRAFHELLFAHQPEEGGPGLTDDQLVEYAAQAGATGDAVESAIRERRYADWVAAATDRASQDGVNATPTVLVDGEQLDTSDLTPDEITAAVQAAAQG
ncbi:DsbA family protein [Modestobacter sp. SYSU DS0875]